ncbi:unnamed protein product [Calypogeia fissa]
MITGARDRGGERRTKESGGVVGADPRQQSVVSGAAGMPQQGSRHLLSLEGLTSFAVAIFDPICKEKVFPTSEIWPRSSRIVVPVWWSGPSHCISIHPRRNIHVNSFVSSFYSKGFHSPVKHSEFPYMSSCIVSQLSRSRSPPLVYVHLLTSRSSRRAAISVA